MEIKKFKLLLSFKTACRFEVQRHIEAYEDDEYEEMIWQETRLFDVIRVLPES